MPDELSAKSQSTSWLSTIGRVAYSTVAYSALLAGLYGTSLTLNAANSARLRRDGKSINDVLSSSDLIGKLRVRDGEQFSISQLLSRNSVIWDNSVFVGVDELMQKSSRLLSAQFAGPWNIDDRSQKLLNQVGKNLHLDTGLKIAALNNLDEKGFPIFIAPSSGFEGRGFYDRDLNVVVVNSLYVSDILKAATSHEFYHSIIDAVYKSSSNPYGNSEQEAIFTQAMHDTFVNLHKRFLPDLELPAEIDGLIANLKEIDVSHLSSPDKKIMESILMVIDDNYYSKEEYHCEMAVKLPEFIGRFDNLPPHVIDDIAPLVNYYKTVITPDLIDYIESHPKKGNLLPSDQDRYYPETIMGRSGEDELLAKSPEKLSDKEKLLISQIRDMQDYINGGDFEAASKALLNIYDERVLRASITSCIESEICPDSLLESILSRIQAPQYLGPQLVKAAELDKTDIALKLSAQIDDQYYLARTVEAALDCDNYALLEATVSKVSPWFLQRSAEKFPDNKLVVEAYIKRTSIAESILWAYDAAKEVLVDIPTNIIRSNLFRHDSGLDQEASMHESWHLKIANFDDIKFQKAQQILAKLESTKSDHVNQEKFFDYLMSFAGPEDKGYKRGMEILENPDIIDYLNKYGDRERQINSLAGIDFGDNKVGREIEVLLQADDQLFFETKKILADPVLSGFVNNLYGDQSRRLYYIRNFDDLKLDKVKELLKMPEFQDIIKINDDNNKAIIEEAAMKEDVNAVLNPPYLKFDQSLETLLFITSLDEIQYQKTIEEIKGQKFKQKNVDPNGVMRKVEIEPDQYQSFVSGITSSIGGMVSAFRDVLFKENSPNGLQEYLDVEERAKSVKDQKIAEEALKLWEANETLKESLTPDLLKTIRENFKTADSDVVVDPVIAKGSNKSPHR